MVCFYSQLDNTNIFERLTIKKQVRNIKIVKQNDERYIESDDYKEL
jgi:hypothetical protein